MSTALHHPHMTRDAFFAWAEARDGRTEFDGLQPVAMTGGTRDHARRTGNVALARHTRRRGSPCEALAVGAGVATIGDAARYPDVLGTTDAA
jgi:Uma2 family endonuclease